MPESSLARVQFVTPIYPDEALLVKVTRFAFTANNITYAATGDRLKYWTLFPAPDGFGNIPVWGFGKVIASKHPNVAVGEILFGYFPMATHLVIEATEVSKRALRILLKRRRYPRDVIYCLHGFRFPPRLCALALSGCCAD